MKYIRQEEERELVSRLKETIAFVTGGHFSEVVTPWFPPPLSGLRVQLGMFSEDSKTWIHKLKITAQDDKEQKFFVLYMEDVPDFDIIRRDIHDVFDAFLNNEGYSLGFRLSVKAKNTVEGGRLGVSCFEETEHEIPLSA